MLVQIKIIWDANYIPAELIRRMWLTVASGARGGHSHQLPYGGVPLYRVDFERPVSLK